MSAPEERAARELARECMLALELRGVPVAPATLPRAPGEGPLEIPLLVAGFRGRPLLIQCLSGPMLARGKTPRRCARFAAAGFTVIAVRSVRQLFLELGLEPPGGGTEEGS